MPKKPSPSFDAKIPVVLMSLPFPYPNCDTRIKEASIFCSDLCRDEAKFVRYFRACLLDGRYDQPDVQEALRIRLAFILGGGYAERARRLPPSVREAVVARDKGKCRACGRPGNQIDHISGGSGDLGNLQLLCPECHNKKTTATFIKISAQTHPEEWAKREALLARVHARKAVRFCDSADWDKIWRVLLKSRRETQMAANKSLQPTANSASAELVRSESVNNFETPVAGSTVNSQRKVSHVMLTQGGWADGEA